MLLFFLEPCKTGIKCHDSKKNSLYLPINVVVHGDVGVRDVDLNVEVGDVFDPGVVAVPHQRLHGDDCVN